MIADKPSEMSVMASTFGSRYQENTALEKKRLDGERQHRNMVRIAKMRGKHAFWQNLQVITLFTHILFGTRTSLH